MDEAKRYLANPEVSLRDEGEDGALLFNPDTNDLAVINPSGRTLWRLLETPRDCAELAAQLTTIFQGVTLEQAGQDIEQYLRALTPTFILELEYAAG